MEDKIILIQGDSRKIDLPEKVDLIVTEILGHIASQEGIINVLNDARRRHLKEGGHVIPYRSRTHIAAVRLPDALLIPTFEAVAAMELEELFNKVGYPFDVRLHTINFPIHNIVSTFGLFEYLDFSSFITENDVQEVQLQMLEDSTIDGFLLWLNLETKQDLFINILGNQNLGAWSPVYFPVFDESLSLSRGDVIEIKCTRILSENGLNPDYHLEGSIMRENKEKLHFTFSSKFYNKDYKSNKFYKALFENTREVISSAA